MKVSSLRLLYLLSFLFLDASSLQNQDNNGKKLTEKLLLNDKAKEVWRDVIPNILTAELSDSLGRTDQVRSPQQWLQDYDVNLDSKLNSIEFTECAVTEYGLLQPVAKDIFTYVDTDNNQQLTLDELQMAKDVLENIAQKITSDLFDKYNKNGDDHLSKDEVQKLAKELYNINTVYNETPNLQLSLVSFAVTEMICNDLLHGTSFKVNRSGMITLLSNLQKEAAVDAMDKLSNGVIDPIEFVSLQNIMAVEEFTNNNIAASHPLTNKRPLKRVVRETNEEEPLMISLNPSDVKLNGDEDLMMDSEEEEKAEKQKKHQSKFENFLDLLKTTFNDVMESIEADKAAKNASSVGNTTAIPPLPTLPTLPKLPTLPTLPPLNLHLPFLNENDTSNSTNPMTLAEKLPLIKLPLPKRLFTGIPNANLEIATISPVVFDGDLAIPVSKPDSLKLIYTNKKHKSLDDRKNLNNKSSTSEESENENVLKKMPRILDEEDMKVVKEPNTAESAETSKVDGQTEITSEAGFKTMKNDKNYYSSLNKDKVENLVMENKPVKDADSANNQEALEILKEINDTLSTQETPKMKVIKTIYPYKDSDTHAIAEDDFSNDETSTKTAEVRFTRTVKNEDFKKSKQYDGYKVVNAIVVRDNIKKKPKTKKEDYDTGYTIIRKTYTYKEGLFGEPKNLKLIVDDNKEDVKETANKKTPKPKTTKSKAPKSKAPKSKAPKPKAPKSKAPKHAQKHNEHKLKIVEESAEEKRQNTEVENVTEAAKPTTAQTSSESTEKSGENIPHIEASSEEDDEIKSSVNDENEEPATAVAAPGDEMLENNDDLDTESNENEFDILPVSTLFETDDETEDQSSELPQTSEQQEATQTNSKESDTETETVEKSKKKVKKELKASTQKSKKSKNKAKDKLLKKKLESEEEEEDDFYEEPTTTTSQPVTENLEDFQNNYRNSFAKNISTILEALLKLAEKKIKSESYKITENGINTKIDDSANTGSLKGKFFDNNVANGDTKLKFNVLTASFSENEYLTPDEVEIMTKTDQLVKAISESNALKTGNKASANLTVANQGIKYIQEIEKKLNETGKQIVDGSANGTSKDLDKDASKTPDLKKNTKNMKTYMSKAKANDKVTESGEKPVASEGDHPLEYYLVSEKPSTTQTPDKNDDQGSGMSEVNENEGSGVTNSSSENSGTTKSPANSVDAKDEAPKVELFQEISLVGNGSTDVKEKAEANQTKETITAKKQLTTKNPSKEGELKTKSKESKTNSTLNHQQQANTTTTEAPAHSTLKTITEKDSEFSEIPSSAECQNEVDNVDVC
uniref:EF-hand domain-containing protein n=1 Tax=Syphacia muris TaxID=451379 RepID=A0A0N5AJ73_9BILA